MRALDSGPRTCKSQFCPVRSRLLWLLGPCSPRASESPPLVLSRSSLYATYPDALPHYVLHTISYMYIRLAIYRSSAARRVASVPRRAVRRAAGGRPSMRPSGGAARPPLPSSRPARLIFIIPARNPCTSEKYEPHDAARASRALSSDLSTRLRHKREHDCAPAGPESSAVRCP